jgi:hypothetical protein
MNWKRNIFKPKWQSKNAEIRLESVCTEQDPELISNLLEIAGKDEDKRVRCAAVKRLHQLGNILKLYDSESDTEVRSLLEERIRQLAASSSDGRPPLELRMQVAESTTNRDLIEHLACHAPEPELRRAALARVERQGVLGDCCIQDTDADNRRFAASRITQHTSLKRVIDALRKRDKTLHAELQERLHEELLQKNDPKAIQAEALRLCSGLEKLSLHKDNRDKAEVDSLHNAWHRIADHASAEMCARYQRACERLASPTDLISPVKTTETPEEEASRKPDSDQQDATSDLPQPSDALARAASDIGLYESENPERVVAASVNKLKNQLEKAWKQCTPPHPHDTACRDKANAVLQKLESRLEQQRQQAEADLEKARTLLTSLETELEQGELHKALETRAMLQKLGKGRGKNRGWQQINRKMSGMHARLRELREWHHWSNNKIRKRLIAEMEVLPATDLHPDALLDRIKSLQAEWKALEKSEQIPGEKHFAAAPWMWRKFSAAGHAAFDTVKPYLDKRSEIQSRHAQSLATFCAELEQLSQAEPMDWTALAKGLNRGRKKLRDLNNVPARQRQKFARKLKKALDKANAVMQDHYQQVEVEKMKLIRAASQLIHLPERSEAISQAKALQSDWKAAGSLWRSKEQEFWNQFRAHLDPLFEELKQQQASVRAADNEKLEAQKALCAGLKEILESDEELSALHGKVQGLQDGWKEIQHPDKRLQKSFQDMFVSYQRRLEKAEQQKLDMERERLWLKSALLHELTVSGLTAKGAISKKTETRVKKNWPENGSDDPLEAELDNTVEHVMEENAPAATEQDIEDLRQQARALCIRVEFLAGLPSPEEDRDQRMKYQVDRLADSMSGEMARQPVAEEAAEVEKIWLGMYTLPEPDYKTFGERIKLALSTIMESI